VVGVAPFVAVGVVSSAIGVVPPVVVGVAAVVLPKEVPSVPHAATRATTAIITRVDTIALLQRQLPRFNKEYLFILNELPLLITG